MAFSPPPRLALSARMGSGSPNVRRGGSVGEWRAAQAPGVHIWVYPTTRVKLRCPGGVRAVITALFRPTAASEWSPINTQKIMRVHLGPVGTSVADLQREADLQERSEPISLSRTVTACVRTGRTEAVTDATDDRG